MAGLCPHQYPSRTYLDELGFERVGQSIAQGRRDVLRDKPIEPMFGEELYEHCVRRISLQQTQGLAPHDKNEGSRIVAAVLHAKDVLDVMPEEVPEAA